MGKSLQDPEDKIVQRSIGFTFRQIRFMNANPNFKPDIFCRKAVDEQISMIDSKFIKEKNG